MQLTSKLNPFKTSRFLWVDGGLSKFGKLNTANVFPDILNINQHLPELSSKFMISVLLKYQWESIIETCHNVEKYMWESNSFFIGTLMGLTLTGADEFEMEWRQFIWKYINRYGVLNNDQITLFAMFCEKPRLFQVIQTPIYTDTRQHLGIHHQIEKNIKNIKIHIKTTSKLKFIQQR